MTSCDTGLLGVCKPGTQTCNPDGKGYGTCTQNQQASFDDCLTAADEDCDGQTPACSGTSAQASATTMAGDDARFGVAVDANGNIFTGGITGATLMPDGYTVSNKGGAVFAKAGMNSWTSTVTSTGYSAVRGVAVDANGNLFGIGEAKGSLDFGNSVTVNTGSDVDVFIAKYNGGTALGAKNFGDAQDQYGYAIALDASGNIFVTGTFNGTLNFGGSDLKVGHIFVAKITGNGAHVWSKVFGDGTPDQVGRGLAVTSTGDVIVVGEFAGKANFGGGDLVSSGGADAFVAKLAAADGSHVWSQRFGDGPSSSTTQSATAVSIDAGGDVAIAGTFVSSIALGGPPITSGGGNDAFVARLNANGNVMWAKGLGGMGYQAATGVSVDPVGNITAVGQFVNTIDCGGGAIAAVGGQDTFVAKLKAADGSHVWSKGFGETPGMASDQNGWGVAVDSKGNSAVVGGFQGTMVFGPPAGTLTAQSGWDGFIAVLAP
jgi:hypothetical protein